MKSRISETGMWEMWEKKKPRVDLPGADYWNASVSGFYSAFLPADRGYPFPVDWIPQVRARLGRSLKILVTEFPTVDFASRRQKTLVLGHLGSLSVGIDLGITHAVLHWTHDGHLLHYVLIFPSAFLHAFLYGVEHRAEGVGKAGAFNHCRTVLE